MWWKMKESERLTTATYKHMTDKYKTATKKWEVSFRKVYDQLFAYEETGLSPEEVEKLKAENAELRAKVEVSKLALESACRHIDEVGETCAVCIFSGTTNCVPYCNAVENMVKFFNEESEARLKELERGGQK